MKYDVTIHTTDSSDFNFTGQDHVPNLINPDFSLTDSEGITMNFNSRNVIAIEYKQEDLEPVMTSILNKSSKPSSWW